MTQAATKPQEVEESPSNAPILVDLGKKASKKLKKLRKGRGPLMDVIEETVAELKSHKQIGENAQPVVIVVREKKKGPKFMSW